MSIFEDLRTVGFQGRSWAVLDKLVLDGHNFLGLIPKSDIESAASAFESGSMPRLPLKLIWVEDVGAELIALDPVFQKKLEAYQRDKAAHSFRLPRKT